MAAEDVVPETFDEEAIKANVLRDALRLLDLLTEDGCEIVRKKGHKEEFWY
jgi:hypothetical protein